MVSQKLKMHPLSFTPDHNVQFSYMRFSEADDTSFRHDTNNSVFDTGFQRNSKNQTDSSKRGRPRADVVTSLILRGSASKGKIRCDVCSRIFPREKSLQAHMRTHTGERPYACDFPGCDKAFCQSGQLKTHQRLHTGEKPFACSDEGCSSRFTHANRHCNEHPYAGLRRVKTEVTGPERYWDYADHSSISQWLLKQSELKLTKTKKKKPRSMKRKHSTDCLVETSDDDDVSSSISSQTSHCDTAQADDVMKAQITSADQDQRDKWIGALALIELSSGFSFQ
ncbi:zinc finger protein 367-like [Littorina saxatilis]|uniref:zinc finger protein 367-like n=1 Tax=Littorina saxatilis TaxID=31220 RepID=UPI0038B49950